MTQKFEDILEVNKEKIYRICRIYAVDPIEPQDLFQEVVFQIWKSLPSFKGEASVDTWVYRIALNVGQRSRLEVARDQSKKVRLDSILFLPADNHENEAQELRYQALRTCIKLLKETDQSLLVLYLEDLPYKAMAAVTGLTENHIAVKMKRIRKLLFDCIAPKLN
ncbi:RNA polymerase sigma factor [Roseivirga misakiensis]|uniref:RNA polymerase sigma factor n=1 Tax=Roseivirga misakiensis TaxID=1563681 RepID=UPI000ABC9B38|nr:sigma-70 family RNA polymerase sigma factor [Roseivirga misakiensis]